MLDEHVQVAQIALVHALCETGRREGAGRTEADGIAIVDGLPGLYGAFEVIHLRSVVRTVPAVKKPVYWRIMRRRGRAVSSVVEHLAFNQLVDGSIPSRPTMIPSGTLTPSVMRRQPVRKRHSIIRTIS